MGSYTTVWSLENCLVLWAINLGVYLERKPLTYALTQHKGRTHNHGIAPHPSWSGHHQRWWRQRHVHDSKRPTKKKQHLQIDKSVHKSSFNWWKTWLRELQEVPPVPGWLGTTDWSTQTDSKDSTFPPDDTHDLEMTLQHPCNFEMLPRSLEAQPMTDKGIYDQETKHPSPSFRETKQVLPWQRLKILSSERKPWVQFTCHQMLCRLVKPRFKLSCELSKFPVEWIILECSDHQK